MRNFLRSLVTTPKVVVPPTPANPFNAPWWCMYADHKPYNRQKDYLEHMKTIHGVDFATGKFVDVGHRAWQCSNTRHSPYGSEQKFLEHMAAEHGLRDTKTKE